LLLGTKIAYFHVLLAAEVILSEGQFVVFALDVGALQNFELETRQGVRAEEKNEQVENCALETTHTLRHFD
jgi:hypothetical protein